MDKVKSLGELPRAIEPARDLWPQIEARIRASQADAAPAADAGEGVGPAALPSRGARRFMAQPWLAAAAMVASVALGVWIGRDLLSGPRAPPVAARAGATVAAAPGGAQANPAVLDAPTALDAAFVSDPRFERQRAALLQSLQAKIAALPPASRARVLFSLETIRKAKEDLEAALGKDPGNALLQELLINTYQDEMRVLTDVHTAGDTGRGI
ncbi:MAG: hypothetical protein JSR67_07675 [Proteobacteria bacterium]|nr:hypothetical protein [Pseudomonadota bacterium]